MLATNSIRQFIFFSLTVYITFLSVASSANTLNIIIEKLPTQHPNNSTIYLAGTINGWQPNNPDYQFTLNKKGQYQLNIPFEKKGDILQFKLTRGSWATQELDQKRYIKENREVHFSNQKQLFINIAHWQDISGSLGRPSTVTGQVDIITKQLKYKGKYRTIRVFVPANYSHSKQDYQVLYMFDGQNLFDQATASVGMEWEIDETLTQRAMMKKAPMIVVGIDSGKNCNRLVEYTAWTWQAQSCGQIAPQGKAFAHFIAKRVKPYIDQQYRTKRSREFTYIGGSSLGGYMAVYTAMSYQGIFSKAFGLSNAVVDEYSGKELKQYIRKTKKRFPMKFYIDIGDQEAMNQTSRSAYIVNANNAFYQSLLGAGFSQQEVKFSVIRNGLHDEKSWYTRVNAVLNHLNIN